MDFLKRWFLTFIVLTIIVIVATLMAIIFCWLYQSALGQLILIMIGVSLMMTFIDSKLK